MDVTPPENLYYYYPLTMVPAMYPYRTALVGLVRDTKMEAKFKHRARNIQFHELRAHRPLPGEHTKSMVQTRYILVWSKDANTVYCCPSKDDIDLKERGYH